MIKIAELGLDNGVIFNNLIFEGTDTDLRSKMEAEYPITFTLSNSQSVTVYGYKISYLVTDSSHLNVVDHQKSDGIDKVLRRYFSFTA